MTLMVFEPTMVDASIEPLAQKELLLITNTNPENSLEGIIRQIRSRMGILYFLVLTSASGKL